MELQTPSAFTPPASLVDAKRLCKERHRQIGRIQAQIEHFESLWEEGSGMSTAPRGPVDTKVKFIEWRFRARQAIGHKQEEIDQLQEWAEEEARRLRAAHISAGGTLFEQLTALARSLADDRGPKRLSRPEETVLSQAEAYTHRREEAP